MCKWRMSKKDKMGDGTPRRLCMSHSPFNGAVFRRKGTGYFRSFSKLVWKSIWNEHKIIACSYWPYMTPNDYLSIVFHLAVSLHGSCRNNALPWSAREKLQLFPACEKSFLSITRKEYAICRLLRQIETYLLKVEGL